MASFKISLPTLTVSMVSLATGITPTLSLAVSTVLRKSATINLTFNKNGVVYYHVYLTSQATAMINTIEYLKELLKAEQTGTFTTSYFTAGSTNIYEKFGL